MKRSIQFLVLSVIFLQFACQKPGKVHGTVTNFYTGEPVKGLHLSVEKTTDSGGWSGGEGSTNYLGHTTTDENGMFTFDIKRKKTRNGYFVTCNIWTTMSEDPFQEAYFSSFQIPIGNQRVKLNGDKDQEIEFKLVPTCRPRFEMKIPDFVDGDSLAVTASNDDFNMSIVRRPGGSDGGLGSRMYMPCNGKIFLFIHFRRRGVVTERTDTIFVKQFERIDHTIDLGIK